MAAIGPASRRPSSVTARAAPLREVGKVLGLTEDVDRPLAGTVWGSWGGEVPETHARPGLIPTIRVGARARSCRRDDRLSAPSVAACRRLCSDRDRLTELVPIGNAAMEDRTFIEWDKDDIDALGLMKVDVLALGMLTCIRKAFDLMREHYGIDYDARAMCRGGCDVYDMLCRATRSACFRSKAARR
jgi:error-prone DNA polymerase